MPAKGSREYAGGDGGGRKKEERERKGRGKDLNRGSGLVWLPGLSATAVVR